MSSRFAGKGACACSYGQVSNIRLWPSPREDIGATMKPKANMSRREQRACGCENVQFCRHPALLFESGPISAIANFFKACD
jgi:hypothetical protein